jgi:serine kinase of HPr protein (carbohydrate metabolism regulator)
MHNISNSNQALPTPRDSVQLHGVLVRVAGTGVLLLGESGSGKSQCALELIHEGHKLVADDVVEISTIKGRLIGRAPKLIRNLLAIRSVGIVDVSETFGEAAVVAESYVDLCIEICADPVPDEVTGRSFLGCRIPRFVFAPQTRGDLVSFVRTVTHHERPFNVVLPSREEAREPARHI